MERKHYKAIDGLRTIACIGIVMMHVRANTTYDIQGFLYNRVILSFTDFVFLFMVISAFGMCCGYFDRMINNQISLEDFYAKRYQKILPFFACLVMLDVILSHNLEAVIEGFADITLLFGLFPNDISVIGVGWFLGLIFAFYIIFPFYCVLIKTKKRAWCLFIIAVFMNFVFGNYFELNRTNIIYSLCYLLAGGLIYHYQNELAQFSQKYSWASFSFIVVAVIAYYYFGGNTITILLITAAMLTFALGRTHGILQNRFMTFFSSISMEIYLSHMVVFRIAEKCGLQGVIGNGWLQYIFTALITICGAIIFSIILKRGIETVERALNRK